MNIPSAWMRDTLPLSSSAVCFVSCALLPLLQASQLPSAEDTEQLRNELAMANATIQHLKQPGHPLVLAYVLYSDAMPYECDT
jgi:hypothetical protein